MLPLGLRFALLHQSVSVTDVRQPASFLLLALRVSLVN
ncbi:hypothetical protein SynWH8101_1718 [Synechococcus sp. WH 8101]|nr:hypothetical protein SynWH8101_1718 [Synechococcus sp. WH 8101]QNI45537.1 hypothetical protein SynRCC2555_01757 [Synechococcus sp. WH 8101]